MPLTHSTRNARGDVRVRRVQVLSCKDRSRRRVCVHMPALEEVLRRDRQSRGHAGSQARTLSPTHRAGELRDSFEEAATRSPTAPPNLLAAFERAARQRREREAADGNAPGLDRAPLDRAPLDRMTRPARDREPPAPTPERGPEPGRERD